MRQQAVIFAAWVVGAVALASAATMLPNQNGLRCGRAARRASRPPSRTTNPLFSFTGPIPTKQTGQQSLSVRAAGMGILAITYEGHDMAEWFRSLGVTAFVLKYRHNASGHMHPVPMTDGQRAIRTVRARSGEWGLDPERIGVLGFSAGGHLASTLATHFDAGDAKAADAIDRVSSRPDFLILCYPVITMTEKYMHAGSQKNLIGKSPDEALARSLSNDLQVTSDTPPTFIFQTDEDKSVPAENCVSFYMALRRAGVPAEMHIYQNGRHGVGMAKEIPGTNDWTERCREWMNVRGLLARPK